MSESRFSITKMTPTSSTQPMTAFISPSSRLPVRYEPKPGREKTVSISTALQQRAVGQRHYRQELHENVAKRVIPDHLTFS